MFRGNIEAPLSVRKAAVVHDLRSRQRFAWLSLFGAFSRRAYFTSHSA